MSRKRVNRKIKQMRRIRRMCTMKGIGRMC